MASKTRPLISSSCNSSLKPLFAGIGWEKFGGDRVVNFALGRHQSPLFTIPRQMNQWMRRRIKRMAPSNESGQPRETDRCHAMIAAGVASSGPLRSAGDAPLIRRAFPGVCEAGQRCIAPKALIRALSAHRAFAAASPLAGDEWSGLRHDRLRGHTGEVPPLIPQALPLFRAVPRHSNFAATRYPSDRMERRHTVTVR